MKKWIRISLLFTILVATICVYYINRYPANYVYQFEGPYENFSIHSMHEHEGKIVAITRNYDVLPVGLHDRTYDDMITLAFFDESLDEIRMMPLTETLTLDNDGLGVQHKETSLRSSQEGQYVYVQVSHDESDYMFVVDLISETYHTHSLEMSLDSFYVAEGRIHAVTSEIDDEGTTYYLNHYVLDVEMTVLSHSSIGSFDTGTEERGESVTFSLNPQITPDFIVVQGNLIDHQLDYAYFSIYDFQRETIQLVGNVDLFATSFYIIENRLYYDEVTIYGEETTFVYSDRQFELYPITSNGFRYGIFPTTTLEFTYQEGDFWQNQARLIVRETGDEIVLTSHDRVIYKAMYEFDGYVYFVVSFTDDLLTQ